MQLNEKRVRAGLDGYLEACRGEKAKLPNLAGLCRHLGVGLSFFSEWAVDHEGLFDYVKTVLEDEMWNSPLSSSLLSSYFKERLKGEIAGKTETVLFAGGMDGD